MIKYRILNIITLVIFFSESLHPQELISVEKGWANNSVNTTVFRKNSLVTIDNTQFIAYYSENGYMMLGKRILGSDQWHIWQTQYKGNVADAHNSISIMVDGHGYLHVSWDHHGHPLRYARSIEPYSLELGSTEIMTGLNEENVTYPEFFRLPDKSLIFMYRDGSSGRGNLVLNKYDLRTRKWTQVQHNLISGENKRNAYWQACVDNQGTIHVSWVWRESWLVETNHDLCYARSTDGGITWKNSKGENYDLPIIASTAEYACHIPQNSELINQTSMITDVQGNPYIASYWREQDSEIPQYHVVYLDNGEWKTINLNFRQSPFTLKGGGTKKIPIARPQLLALSRGNKTSLCLIFRDEERGSKVSAAICTNIDNAKWKLKDLTDFSVGSWEPSFDTELWRDKQEIHIFVQSTEQIDGEGKANIPPQMVQILETTKKFIFK